MYCQTSSAVTSHTQNSCLKRASEHCVAAGASDLGLDLVAKHLWVIQSEEGESDPDLAWCEND